MKEFRPALFFVAKFLAFYFVSNILYSLFVVSFHPGPDPLTEIVAIQTSALLRVDGLDASSIVNTHGPTVFLVLGNDTIVNIFEGCNGLNVIIVFVSFLFAYSNQYRKMLWFIPAGIMTIHLFNLARIILLFLSAIHATEYFYYFHKYIFTGILYLVVFALWLLWILKFDDKKFTQAAT